MRRSLVALIPAVISLLVAACGGDRESTAPRAATGGPSFAPGGNNNQCNFSDTKTAARAWLISNTDPLLDLIGAHQTAFRDGALAATPAAVNVLAEIAVARKATDPARVNNNFAAAGSVVSGTALCSVLGPISATDAQKAVANGVFEIRGGSGDGAGPALNYPGAAQTWGAEVNAQAIPVSTWTQACTGTQASPICVDRVASSFGTNKRFLVYGAPGIANADLSGEIPADANFKGFAIASLPAAVDKTGLGLGACNLSGAAPAGSISALIHGGQIYAVDVPDFCSGVTMTPTRGWLATATENVLSLLTPRLAYAAPVMFDDDDSGGGPTSWSPIAFGEIEADGTTLTFAHIANARAGTDLGIKVNAETAAGNPAGGVAVTVSISGNSGIPAGAILIGPSCTPDGSSCTVTTDHTGTATFTGVGVNKPGGFNFGAAGLLGGFPTGTAISNQVQVRNNN